MSVAAATTPESAEQLLRPRALEAVRGTAFDVVLASQEPLRTADVARSIAERLELALTEEEMGGLASLSRMLMDGDPLFSQSQRQWDLALRMGRAEGDRRKPVEKAVEDFIELIGHPAAPRDVAELIGAVYGRPPSYYERLIQNLGSRSQFFTTDDGRIGITRWLIDISSDDPEDVEADNFTDRTVLDALRAQVADLSDEDALGYAQAVVRKVGGPVDNRSLLYLTWRAFPDSDPDELFLELLDADGIRLDRGPSWCTDAVWQTVLTEVKSVLSDPELLADSVIAAIPTEEEEAVLRGPTTVRVADDDLEQVFQFMSEDPRSYRVSELCQQVLEAFPGGRTYPAMYASLAGRMSEDPRFLWVGWERYRVAGSLPPEVTVVPDGMAFDDREYYGEEGEEVDRVVPAHDWKYALADQIGHYLVQDYGDDGTRATATPPTRLECSIPLHHYVAGTSYLRQSDRSFFPAEPEHLQVSLVVANGQKFDIWVNTRLGFLYGLKEWYDANLPWVGGHFLLERTELPDEFQLSYRGEVEPLMDVPMDQLPTLLGLRADAAAEGLPLTIIVQRVLQSRPEGMHFVMLFTQVNIVRRTRRAQLASILSSQRYFTQSPQMPGIWSFDEKRAQRPKRRGGPKRPSRAGYLDDEDEDIE